MTISYKWLSEYLPVILEPERLSRILTSIGLEVEKMEQYEEIRGGLKGLILGEILSIEKHPNADKLTLTRVNTGNGEPLQIVCGAPNVQAGQKVVVAPVGSTIYPTSGNPLTMKIAKIRNVESYGMICAEDEIGIGTSHEGILVLPPAVKPGTKASDYFKPYDDIIYEIGLTPNRMDAMSHWGVARDICSYLSHHDKKELKPKLPITNNFKIDNNSLPIKVKVENDKGCPRYSGLSFTNLTIGDSPIWMQQRLKATGVRPINGIVDITNYIQHETGQPLHAFDADELNEKQIIVKNLPEGTPFITLDEKERKLSGEDLMICDGKGGICIAGVFGGLHSGVTDKTRNIFLESAYFDPITIRKTSFRHQLRTDAAMRFEKGTDISSTVIVLKRAAQLIKEIAGGNISSEIVDIYPQPAEKQQVSIKYHYLKRLSGKNYHPDAIKNILTNLGFEVLKEGMDELRVAVPYHKPDITLPADLVEEILRIDGLDNVPIPDSITITPALEENSALEKWKEKVSDFLTGLGFNEILTNSITNAGYFSEGEKEQMVKMINSLSNELNILRNSLFETALEVVSHNLNHKNNNLRLFEFGKAYTQSGSEKYEESEELCLVLTGNSNQQNWREKNIPVDFYQLKGAVNAILELMGITPESIETLDVPKLENHIVYKINGRIIAGAGEVNKEMLKKFNIKQPVFFAGMNWAVLAEMAATRVPEVKELPRFPSVHRDLAMIVDSSLPFMEVERTADKIKKVSGGPGEKLKDVQLFDLFESEKLGSNKKSLALSFTFLDEEKTLTDKEIDGWMQTIMTTFERDLKAEIRKQ